METFVAFCGVAAGWLVLGYIAVHVHLYLQKGDPFIQQYPVHSTKNDPGMLIIIVIFGPILLLAWGGKVAGYIFCKILPVEQKPLKSWFLVGL